MLLEVFMEKMILCLEMKIIQGFLLPLERQGL